MADQREQLIERTARLIHQNYSESSWDEVTYTDRVWAEGTARKILTLVEEANTPTGDEREAAALHLWDEGLVRPESLARSVIDSLISEGWHLHLTVQGEPESAGASEKCRSITSAQGEPIFDRFGEPRNRSAQEAQAAADAADEVVQGEPSDAADLSQTRVVYRQDCDCDVRTKYCDENHTRSARVPLAALRAAAATGGQA